MLYKWMPHSELYTIFIIKPIAVSLSITLSRLHIAVVARGEGGVKHQIKLILRKLLVAMCAHSALLFYLLTNCFCFPVSATDMIGWDWKGFGFESRSGFGLVWFCLLFPSFFDCPLWCSGFAIDFWHCGRCCCLFVELSGNWFVHFMSRFCYWH